MVAKIPTWSTPSIVATETLSIYEGSLWFDDMTISGSLYNIGGLGITLLGAVIIHNFYAA